MTIPRRGRKSTAPILLPSSSPFLLFVAFCSRAFLLSLPSVSQPFSLVMVRTDTGIQMQSEPYHFAKRILTVGFLHRRTAIVRLVSPLAGRIRGGEKRSKNRGSISLGILTCMCTLKFKTACEHFFRMYSGA